VVSGDLGIMVGSGNGQIELLHLHLPVRIDFILQVAKELVSY
jgi:hypothetical protein